MMLTTIVIVTVITINLHTLIDQMVCALKNSCKNLNIKGTPCKVLNLCKVSEEQLNETVKVTVKSSAIHIYQYIHVVIEVIYDSSFPVKTICSHINNDKHRSNV